MNAELKAHIDKTTRASKTGAAVEEIIDQLNTMTEEDVVVKAISDKLLNSHRTLQQSFVTAMLLALSKYGQEAHTDARNQSAVDYCKQIKTDEINFPFI